MGRDDIVGVLCPASDVGLPAQARLARHWNLPNPPSGAAVRASTDKAVFRAICDRLGLPGYRSVAGRPSARLVAAARRLRYPTLVKPVDSSGSRGVVCCPNPGHLEAAFAEATAHSPAGRVVVEELVDGDHLTIEALVVDGRVVFHAITERTLTPPPFFVTTSHLLPVQLPPAATTALVATLDAVCAELRYEAGPLTVDAILHRDGSVRLIEMSARMGGNGVAELIESSCGVDLMGASIRIAVGERCTVQPNVPSPTLVHMLTSDRAGHVVAIEGVEEVLAIPEVVDLRLFAEVGSAVWPYEQAGYKVGQVVLSGSSPARLRAAQTEVQQTIRFLLAEHDVAVSVP